MKKNRAEKKCIVQRAKGKKEREANERVKPQRQAVPWGEIFSVFLASLSDCVQNIKSFQQLSGHLLKIERQYSVSGQHSNSKLLLKRFHFYFHLTSGETSRLAVLKKLVSWLAEMFELNWITWQPTLRKKQRKKNQTENKELGGFSKQLLSWKSCPQPQLCTWFSYWFYACLCDCRLLERQNIVSYFPRGHSVNTFQLDWATVSVTTTAETSCPQQTVHNN